jgi:hypothetical protein
MRDVKVDSSVMRRRQFGLAIFGCDDWDFFRGDPQMNSEEGPDTAPAREKLHSHFSGPQSACPFRLFRVQTAEIGRLVLVIFGEVDPPHLHFTLN